MRLGLVIYGSLDTLSGGYLYDRRLVEHLRASGDQVEVISLPWQSYAVCLRHNLGRRWLDALSGAAVDLLLEDELNHPSLFWLNRRVRRLRPALPILSVVHHLRSSEEHPAGLRPLYRWVERAYLRSVDGFLFNSQTTRAAVEALLGRPARGLVAYPAGNRFGVPQTSVRESGGPLRLLFVGNLIRRKGLHTLLNALRALPAAGLSAWQLTIVGREDIDRRYARDMHALAAPLGERVQFKGRLSDAELQTLWPRHDLLVVPSYYEGFGIVYLEAMAFGLPAVATTAGAAPEIIQDGVNGCLVPPENVAALQRALAGLMADRARLEAMRGAARGTFERFPIWQESMASARAFLQSWLAPEKGTR